MVRLAGSKKTECTTTTFFGSSTLLLICTISTMLLLVLLYRVGSYVVFGPWISARARANGILELSCLLVGFGCVYFPLQWITKYLEEVEYFGSNFQ